ncbi:AAEL002757-PA [Aedes aegypti]|uniref:AAEL002757-PA n=2 Tax=Aedes aegypti TaxID=7159 RepID=A0A1S4F2P2_AEDAE|nr:uncharacterized protein LOC5575990 [Aedes aegypti]EAT46005.1 AAEL002757-PA [Aedes aegypti]
MGQTSSRYHLDAKSPFNLTRWYQTCWKRLNFSQLKSWGFIDGSLKSSICSNSNCSSCFQNGEPSAQNISSAIDNLVSVIGNVGFQLAVNSLEMENLETAIFHLKLGARHLNASAVFNLGICYELGIGVKKKSNMAKRCFYVASNLGHPGAMYNLGVYYALGLGGLGHNRKMAKMCFIAAAVLGQEDAIAVLDQGYPQIVRQVKDLEDQVSPDNLLIMAMLVALMTVTIAATSISRLIVFEKYHVKKVIRSCKIHYKTVMFQQKRQRIFQPRKMTGGLKHWMKTRLLEGQHIVVC